MKRSRAVRFIGIAPAVGVALALLAAVAAADVRQLETEGSFALQPGEQGATPPRDAAVRLALNEAVRRVALDLMPGLGPEEAADYLPEVLGDDPFEYTSGYRISEDRGESPTQGVGGAGPSLAYVVVVEAQIDAERVAKRLEGSGLMLGDFGAASAEAVRVVVEGLVDYTAWAALRNLLVDSVSVDSALPVEMERRRSELRVETRLAPEQLLEELLAAAPPEMQITPLDVRDGAIRLRVALLAPSAPGEAGAAPSGVPPD